MIRIIKEMFVSQAADTTSTLAMQRLPMIPASGTLETKETVDDNGRCLTHKIELRCTVIPTSTLRIIRYGCIARVVFSDGTSAYLGTADLPLRIETEDNLDVLRLSASWKTVPAV